MPLADRMSGRLLDTVMLANELFAVIIVITGLLPMLFKLSSTVSSNMAAGSVLTVTVILSETACQLPFTFASNV